MKCNGILENWKIENRPGITLIRFTGNIFGFGGNIPDGIFFDLYTKTEPPYFKSRIVKSASGKFYRLGEPAKEDTLV